MEAITLIISTHARAETPSGSGAASRKAILQVTSCSSTSVICHLSSHSTVQDVVRVCSGAMSSCGGKAFRHRLTFSSSADSISAVTPGGGGTRAKLSHNCSIWTPTRIGVDCLHEVQLDLSFSNLDLPLQRAPRLAICPVVVGDLSLVAKPSSANPLILPLSLNTSHP